MQLRNCQRAICAVAVLLITTLTAAASDLSHEQKAKDWLDLGDFNRARDELSQAIAKVPKNVEARIILSESYIKESQARGRDTSQLIMYALDNLRLVDLIERNQSRSAPVRTAAYRRLAVLYEQGGAGVVDVLKRFPAPEAVPLLEKMMASRDRQVAVGAESILEAIEPARVRRILVELLGAPGLEIREHAAARLWQRERYDGARPILRAKLLRELPGKDYQDEATKMVALVLELGYAEAAEGLVDLLRKGVAGQVKMAAALAALEALVANNEPRAGEIARAVIAYTSVKQAGTGCYQTTLPFVRALGRLKGAENYAALKDAFSYVILVGSCLDRYQDALAAHDGQPWRSMKTRYGGWDIFGTVISGRFFEARVRGNGYGADEWKLIAPGADSARDRLNLLMQRLGPATRFGGGRGIRFIPQRVAFESPGKARMTMHMHDMDRSYVVAPQAAGRFTLVLEAVGAYPKQPWVVTAAEDGHLDGQQLF